MGNGRRLSALGVGVVVVVMDKGGYTLRSFDVTFTHCGMSLKPAFYAIPLVATAGQMNFNATQT